MGKKNSSKKATTSAAAAVAETPAPAPVVALPPRNVEANAVRAPVWSLEPEAVEEDVPVPLGESTPLPSRSPAAFRLVLDHC